MSNFIEVIKRINMENKRSGNDAIYEKCCNSIFIEENASVNEKKKVSEYLEGMLWLIGRSYAASPQRRSYGKSHHLKAVKNDKGDDVLRSIWPVRTENSGNGDFFAELAASIVNRKIENANDYDELAEIMRQLMEAQYSFNITEELTSNIENLKSSNDFKIMLNSIIAVSKLNRLIKRSSEIFDLVNEHCDSHKHTIPQNFRSGNAEHDYVYCKNQISFSSKFLHFFCPKNIFIIDQFSEKGGRYIFPEKLTNTQYYIANYEISFEDEHPISGQDDYRFIISKEYRRQIINEYETLRKQVKKCLLIELEDEMKMDEEEIVNLSRNSDHPIEKTEEKDAFFYGYMNHVINSYMLCCYIKRIMDEKFVPEVSYPRLSDSVFMRTKKLDVLNTTHKDPDFNEIYYS